MAWLRHERVADRSSVVTALSLDYVVYLEDLCGLRRVFVETEKDPASEREIPVAVGNWISRHRAEWAVLGRMSPMGLGPCPLRVNFADGLFSGQPSFAVPHSES